MSTWIEYIEKFNANDEETVKQYVDNEHAAAFLWENFPRLSCPDQTIEETFAFRSWTLRKHIQKTEDGFVFSEFLPPVSWGSKHNTINAALCHHLNESRWIKNSAFGLEYLLFFLEEKGNSYAYYTPALTEMFNFLKVTGNEQLILDHAEQFEHYVSVFNQRHLLANGLYWSMDDRDAMEDSISGMTPALKPINGIRPTMNSYMYGCYQTLSKIFAMKGDTEKEKAYADRAKEIKEKYLSACRDGHFFKAIHLPAEQLNSEVSVKDILPEMNVKEEIGYIPFAYGLYEKGDEISFGDLFDNTVFHTPYGITTADQSHPRFLYEFDHECLWNGYIWPYATSQTITAMIRVLEAQGEHDFITHQNLYSLLLDYSKMHYLTENGKTVSWIDEVMSPVDGSWYSRNWLRERGWQQYLGGYERGKDYNHSTYLDLVLRGLIGIREDTDKLTVEPRIKGIWQWFSVENLTYRGKTYNIYYDEDGTHFSKGVGLRIEQA